MKTLFALIAFLFGCTYSFALDSNFSGKFVTVGNTAQTSFVNTGKWYVIKNVNGDYLYNSGSTWCVGKLPTTNDAEAWKNYLMDLSNNCIKSANGNYAVITVTYIWEYETTSSPFFKNSTTGSAYTISTTSQGTTFSNKYNAGTGVYGDTYYLCYLGLDGSNVAISSNNKYWYVYEVTLSSEKHTYVDLGLPSGTLWATENIGASSPEEYGLYYAWGETITKTTYDTSTYSAYVNSKYTKYNSTDNITVLESGDDAAISRCGSSCKTPSVSQFQELIDNCTATESSYNNVKGLTVKGPNGKSIFLPFSGYYNSSVIKYEGLTLSAMTSERSTDCDYKVFTLYYNTNSLKMIVSDNNHRTHGRTVRPVSTQRAIRVNSIVLNQSSAYLEEGRTLQLSATVSPDNASDKSINWSSSDESVATVDSSGLVKALKAGRTTIGVKANDGSGLSASCLLDVIILGDVNQDNEVNIVDVAHLVDHLKSETTDQLNMHAIDMDDNSSVDKEDIKLIVNKILKK